MSVVERINGVVDEKQGEIVKLLQRLVQIPTPTPPGLNYDRINVRISDLLNLVKCIAILATEAA